MAAPIDFYFDFTSPYGYLMSEKIDALAARFNRKVHWRPILLGAVFKTTGARPLTEVPIKGEYSKRDFARSARFLDIPYILPEPFPIATQNTARAYYWLHDRDCGKARAFAHEAYRAYFTAGRDINDIPTVLELARKVGRPLAAEGDPRSGGEAAASGMRDAGFENAAAASAFTVASPQAGPLLRAPASPGDTAAELEAALATQELKDRLRAEVEAAISRGVCGSPYVVIDDEPFLGVDRLPQIERWLETGGF